MKALLLLVAIVCSAAFTQTEYEYEFTNYMVAYGKTYDVQEFFYRFRNFKAILDEVVAWNSEPHDWQKGINQFSDMSAEEFDQFLTLRPPEQPTVEYKVSAAPGPTFDWMSSTFPVHNQAQCGSCYAFSAVEAMEDGCKIKGKETVQLSEQEIVSCSQSYGNQGCNGGWMDYCFKYAQDKKGIASDKDYPYTSGGGAVAACKSPLPQRHCAISGYRDLAKTENALYDGLKVQPVSIAVCANTFQTYKSGILSTCCTTINHGVLLVGYNSAGITDGYWEIKNSWGAGWGENGYIRVQYGKNLCQITYQNSYPTF